MGFPEVQIHGIQGPTILSLLPMVLSHIPAPLPIQACAEVDCCPWQADGYENLDKTVLPGPVKLLESRNQICALLVDTGLFSVRIFLDPDVFSKPGIQTSQHVAGDGEGCPPTQPWRRG